MARTKTAGKKNRAAGSAGWGNAKGAMKASARSGKPARSAAKASAGSATKRAGAKPAGDNGRDTAAVMEVGRRLVELCRQMKNLEAVATLYSPRIISIETRGDETMPARMEGIDAIRGKNQWWLDNHEVHGAEADGPWPHGNRFIVRHRVDVTPKAGPFAGKRMQFDEAALYTVKNGKIVQEEFFYHMGG